MFKAFIVDDSRVVSDRMKEMLVEKGWIDIFGECGDAVEAIQSIRRMNQYVGILDFCMQGGEGLAVLKDIKTRKAKQVVIVLTSHPYPQYRQAFLASGADTFFEKTKDIQKMNDLLV